ncbi:hypothetical protein CBR_g29462 [Chara braunii]|uniref:Uncharacterized protein n=1 Tax=Chara braunii TaxID=69332 RepID=A0A388LAV3_CHABU|nr:hypothetical protein CBR_g29462 [Chara braunii]|eukprot:GBG79313.1 hypothetical protein CBR_g29462 [Chara braunii]
MEDKHRKDTLQELIKTSSSAEKAYFENLHARDKILQATNTQNPAQITKESQKPQGDSSSNGPHKRLKRKANQSPPNSPAHSTTQGKGIKLKGLDTAMEEMEADSDKKQEDQEEEGGGNTDSKGKKQRGTQEGYNKEGEEMMKEGDEEDTAGGRSEQGEGKENKEEDGTMADDNMAQDSAEENARMGRVQDAAKGISEEDQEDTHSWLA